MSNNLHEEMNKMKNLFFYKRGQVISEWTNNNLLMEQTTYVTSPTEEQIENGTSGVTVGMSGDTVKEIQTLLKTHGYTTFSSSGKPDKFYGSKTKGAVEAFQMNNVDKKGKNLKKDGIVGPKTWWALHQPAKSRTTTDKTTKPDDKMKTPDGVVENIKKTLEAYWEKIKTMKPEEITKYFETIKEYAKVFGPEVIKEIEKIIEEYSKTLKIEIPVKTTVPGDFDDETEEASKTAVTTKPEEKKDEEGSLPDEF